MHEIYKLPTVSPYFIFFPFLNLWLISHFSFSRLLLSSLLFMLGLRERPCFFWQQQPGPVSLPSVSFPPARSLGWARATGVHRRQFGNWMIKESGLLERRTEWVCCCPVKRILLFFLICRPFEFSDSAFHLLYHLLLFYSIPLYHDHPPPFPSF